MKKFGRALAEALYWRKSWDDSNPNVGMGPSLDWLLDQVLESAKLEIGPITRRKVIAEVRRRLDRKH